MYLTVAQLTFLRVSRFDEGEVPTYPVHVPEIFTHVGRPGGKVKKVWFTDEEYQSAHAYVLRNCEYFRPLESLHEQHIRYYNPELSDEEVFAKSQIEFPCWVKDYVVQYSKNKSVEEAFPAWVQEIVQGPRNYGKSWPMYFTRGYLFHTIEYGKKKQTMNYGVCVRGQNFSDASDEADFYGNLEDIIQLQYQGLVGLKITLFKCRWYDPTLGKGTRHRDGGRVVDVLSTGKYHKYDPFVLDSQADQVCYIPYPSKRAPRGLWLNVLKVNPRANIVGKYKEKDVVLLQQENDEDVTAVEEIRVNQSLADETHPDEFIDFEVGDAEANDEFHCNISSSDDDDEEDNEE